MQLRSSSWTFAVWALIPLVTCIGCGDSKSVAPDRNVSDADSAPLVGQDAEVSSAQLVKLGVEKFDAKEYDEAIEFFTKAVEQNPRATNHAFIGDCYWKKGDLDKADFHYLRALEVDRNHCGANHALGRNAVLQKRFEDAIPYLDKANEVCAGTIVHAQNLRLRVEALLELDRLDDAESDLKELVAKYPDDGNTHEAGLMVATRKGDTSLAAEYENKLKANSNGGPN
jgi:Tfp pilus assembly protein PilF